MPKEKVPAVPLPNGYQPADSVPLRVQDGDDWERISRRIGMNPVALIEFNFQTRDPEEVNYYLARNVGCNKATRDGVNWMFSSSATPGIIYVPSVKSKFTGAQSYFIQFAVPHFKGTKPNSCWHDSARMIYQYKRHADLDPLSSNGYWAKDTGLPPGEFVKLTTQLGFRPLPLPPAGFTTAFLGEALSTYGPLWAAGKWNGVNHVIVIAGVNSLGDVWVNDPAFPAQQKRTIAWFNERVYREYELANSLLYLP